MQTDGNFVLYNDTAVVWKTDTQNNPGAFMIMQNDANLVIYNLSYRAIWSSGYYANCTRKIILMYLFIWQSSKDLLL